MSAAKPPRVPPRWFVRTAWTVHRAICRASGGRLGLWRPKPGRWGTLRLATTGRRSGREHQVILGYIEDGHDYVTLAMNGWAAPEPAWWRSGGPSTRTSAATPPGARPRPRSSS